MWKLKILRSIFNLTQDKDINGYNGYFVKPPITLQWHRLKNIIYIQKVLRLDNLWMMQYGTPASTG